MPNPISVIGSVATDPKSVDTAKGLPFCTFRVASNDRRYDRERNEWIDGDTNWFTVNAFRSLALHALKSFQKGDRLVISGRLRVRQWEANGKTGTSVEIDADALGHDVRWGVSTFTKQNAISDAERTDTGSIATAPSDEAFAAATPPVTGGEIAGGEAAADSYSSGVHESDSASTRQDSAARVASTVPQTGFDQVDADRLEKPGFAYTDSV